MQRVCVFAGSSLGSQPAYQAGARQLGQALGRLGWELVYGGSSSGLMGELANAVLEDGGRVVGVMPRGLFRSEMVHPRLSQLITVEDMHERKAAMARLSDAYIALPGGYGTLEELFEAVSWAQLGIHQKPVGIFNIAGYYDPLLQLVEHAIRAGFIRDRQRSLLLVESDVDRLLAQIQAYRAPSGAGKWSPAVERP